MKSRIAIVLLCAAAICLAGVFPAAPPVRAADSAIAARAEAALPAPAAEARKRLDAAVGPNGEKLTIDVDMKGSIFDILGYIRSAAAAPEHGVKIIIDHQGIKLALFKWAPGTEPQPGNSYATNVPVSRNGTPSVALYDRQISLTAKGVTLAQALSMALPEGVSYAVLDDGTVIVSAQSLLRLYTDYWPVPAGPAADPATETRKLLRQKGLVDGRNWSVDLDFKDARLADVLDDLAKQAAAKPHAVRILVDWRTLPNSQDITKTPLPPPFVSPPGHAWPFAELNDAVTIEAKDVSLEQALALILVPAMMPRGYEGARWGYAILPDGAVVISQRNSFSDFTRVRPEESGWTEAAKATYDKLRRRGSQDGQDWSVNLDFDKVSLDSVLDALAAAAAAKPREIKLLVDRVNLADHVSLSQLVILKANDLSLEEALLLAMGYDMACVIRNDGSLTVRPRVNGLVSAKLPPWFEALDSNRQLALEMQNTADGYDLYRKLFPSSGNFAASDAIARQPVHEVLGVPPGDWKLYAGVGSQPQGRTANNGMNFNMGVGIDSSVRFLEVRLAADKLANALVDSMRQALVQDQKAVVDQVRKELKAYEKELAEAEKKQEAAKEEEKQLRDSFGTGALPVVEEVSQKATQLDLRAQDMKADMAGRQARVAAIEKKIADLSARVAAALKADAIVAQQEKVVALRQEQLKALKALLDKGAATKDQLAEKEIALAEDQARLAERQEAVRRDAGGELLTRLNSDLAMVSIDAAESEARYAAIEAQLKEAKDTLAKLRRLKDLQAEVANAGAANDGMESNAKSLKQRLENAEKMPEVIIK